MTRRRIVTQAIASLCCVSLFIAAAGAVERRASSVPAAPVALLAAQVRLPGGGTVPIDLVPALGTAWGEAALRDLLAAFRVKGKPVARRGDLTTFLENYRLGVELTFRYEEVRDVPVRHPRPNTLVLSNIRLYGPANKTHAAFAGDLPFGVRFGDTRQMLIARFGVPDVEVAYIPLLRWDTECYALFAELDKSGRLQRLSLQLPVVTTNRSGFAAR